MKKKMLKLLGVAFLGLMVADAVLDIACIVSGAMAGDGCEGCLGCCRDTGSPGRGDGSRTNNSDGCGQSNECCRPGACDAAGGSGEGPGGA